MCSVTKVAQAFVLVTDTYKQLTRHINYNRDKKITMERKKIYEQ